MEVIKVEGTVAVFLSEYFGNLGILEFVSEEGPFVAKSNHVFDTLFTFHFERYGGGDLRG